MNRRHFLLAALACACAAPVWAAPNLDDLKAAGGLRVAVYRDFPPYSWQEAGEMRGIDADLARAIGRELGLKVTFMPLTPADDVDGDLRNAIWKGHYLGGGTAELMRVAAVLNEQRLRFTRNEAIDKGEQVGVPAGSVDSLLKRMTERGQLVKVGRGEYEFNARMHTRTCVGVRESASSASLQDS